MNLYIAYKTKDDLHLTFSFMDIVPTGKLDISWFPFEIKTMIGDIVYWKEANITVAILDLVEDMLEVKELCEESGFTYNNHKWVPHLTLGVGNQVDKFGYLMDTDVSLTHPYLRLKDFKK